MVCLEFFKGEKGAATSKFQMSFITNVGPLNMTF